MSLKKQFETLGSRARPRPGGAEEPAGPRRWDLARGHYLLVAAILSLVLLLAVSGLALGVHWSDINQPLLDQYSITEDQLAAISDGFPDGTWQPGQTMPRRHFVKMAMDAFGLPRMSPPTATFSDVPPSHLFFADVEGAVAADLIVGVAPGRFAPDDPIGREQAVAVISRFLVKQAGQSLPDLLTEEQANQLLARFSDAGDVGPNLRLEMAYAVQQGIVLGTQDGKLLPRQPLIRIQGATMLIRARSTPTTTTTSSSTTSSSTTSSSTTSTSVPGTTTTSVPGSTTTSVSSTTTTLAPTTTTLPPATTTTTLAPVVTGNVKNTNGANVNGALVTVRWNAANPDIPANTLIGSATANVLGNFTISMAGIPQGTIVDVSASASGFYPVLIFGPYNEVREVVNFAHFTAIGQGDRRLPPEQPGLPPPLLIFEGLLPD